MAQQTTAEREVRTRVPPYIAFRTLKTFTEDLKTHGVPNRIDRSVWGSRFSGSVGAQLMSALRFLHLIDENDQPEPILKRLVAANGTGDWKTVLTEMLRAAYEPILNLDLQTITPQELSEAFRENYTAQENVLRKSIAFFLQAASEAGFEISSRILKRTRQLGQQRIKPIARKSGPDKIHHERDNVDRPAGASRNSTAYQMLIDILDPNGMEKEEQEAVWTLIRYLKKSGKA